MTVLEGEQDEQRADMYHADVRDLRIEKLAGNPGRGLFQGEAHRPDGHGGHQEREGDARGGISSPPGGDSRKEGNQRTRPLDEDVWGIFEAHTGAVTLISLSSILSKTGSLRHANTFWTAAGLSGILGRRLP